MARRLPPDPQRFSSSQGRCVRSLNTGTVLLEPQTVLGPALSQSDAASRSGACVRAGLRWRQVRRAFVRTEITTKVAADEINHLRRRQTFTPPDTHGVV